MPNIRTDLAMECFENADGGTIPGAQVSHWESGGIEITEVLVFADSYTGGYMLHRPNGFVYLPEGTDISEVELYVYCYDKAGKLVGYGSQIAIESSINPILYLEEIPGEHKAKFQTNMIGPFEDMSFPQDSIDHYEIVAFSPSYYY